MPSSSDVVLAAACRTPIGKISGALKTFSGPELGALVLRESLSRAGLDASLIDEVIMGEVVQAGVGQNPARQAALKAGLPNSVSALTVNKVCGSSLKAVVLASQAIRAGDASVILAGGMESMTNAPYLLPHARNGYRYGNGVLVDALYHDGLRDAYNDVAMVETGNVVADEYKVSREDADAFSVRSHKLAAAAHENGWYKNEIVPVEIKSRKASIMVTMDEGVRADSSLESLAKLRVAGSTEGIVTAGNASQLSDGASSLVVASRKAAEEHGLSIMGRIVKSNTTGVAPMRVMAAPIPSTEKLLKATGLSIDDVDLVEHNEAFASASCAVRSALSIPDEKFNISGGAVAMGHPIGASGTRILTTLLYNLKRTGGFRGIATICLGGGNAVSMMVERE